jgi:tetratricopeptide (TPR) repeat protein
VTASSAWVLAQLGEASEALNRALEGEQLLQRQAERGMVADRAWAYQALSRACLLLGRLDEARYLCDRVVESSPCHPGFAAYVPHLLGDIATRPDHFDAENAEAHYRQALALAEPRGMRPLVANCHLSLGKLYRRRGKREQAQEHLTIATAMYREMGMTHWREQVTAEMGQLG